LEVNPEGNSPLKD